VGGGIVGALDGVVGRGDDLASRTMTAPIGTSSCRHASIGLVVGEAHEKVVVAHQLRREAFFERAGQGDGLRPWKS
jgi:hypothetical protein